MSKIVAAIIEAIAGSVFSAIAQMIKDSYARQDQIDLGAAHQRETDMRTENERIAKTADAGAAVAAGGGVPVGRDPFNRDNR
jgi:hypothetical protein